MAVKTETDEGVPRVGIVVRTKDRPAMLRRALASIQGQTYADWEAVIVNDGGAPDALEAVLAESSAAADPRIRVIHHPEPFGRWPSANAGVAATTAPYLVLHDDDDRWHPDFLAETTAHLDAHPDDYGVITHAEVVHEKYEGDELVEVWRYELEDHNPEVLLTDLLEFNRFVPIQFLYRRTLHELLGEYDATKPAAADWMFNLRAVALRPVPYASRRVLAYWHQRPGIDGALGNSVFAAPADHRFADRRHRDEELRAYIARNGAGLPLFLTKALETRTQEIQEAADRREQTLNERIDSLDEALADLKRSLELTIDARLRRWYRELRSKRRRARH